MLFRSITPSGDVSTFAGQAANHSFHDGIGAGALFNYPTALVTDQFNYIYVLDNNNYAIRRISPAGVVSTIAGRGQGSQTDGVGQVSSFDQLNGLSINKGTLTVSELSKIRRIAVTGFTITPDLPQGLIFSEDTGTITGTPLIPQIEKIYTIGASNGHTTGTTTLGITVEQATPVITAVSPLAVDDVNPREITLTGTSLGRNLSEIVSITYGPNGTGANATNIQYESATKVRFTPGVLTPGESYKVIISVGTKVSTASTDAFRANIPPALSFAESNLSLTLGTPVTPVSPVITGDAFTAGITVSTYAGAAGQSGSVNGDALSARFNQPSSAVSDSHGNVFVTADNLIRKISPDGIVTTFAGGNSGGADGQGSNAEFYFPTGLSIDNQDNLYVAEPYVNTIRKITPAAVVSTLAGTYSSSGNADGPGSAALFSGPASTAVDAEGNIFIADKDNHKIRKITPMGEVSTLAGSGNSGGADGIGSLASFYSPSGVATDAEGNIYVADLNNRTIRKITPGGEVSRYAGNGNYGVQDGNSLDASFQNPVGVTVDLKGNVYVAEQNNNVIRKISKSGYVSTIAGQNNNSGSADGQGTNATFYYPNSVSADAFGNLYVAELNNHTIRKVVIADYSITPDLPAGLAFNQLTSVISGTPDQISPSTSYTVTVNNGYRTGSAAINISVALPPPPAISYPALARVFEIGKPIDPIILTSSGSAITGQSKVSTLGAGSGPVAVTKNIDGNFYVADQNQKINKTTPAGITTTFVGGSYGNVDGTGTAAQFGSLQGITSDASGNLYVTDGSYGTIRKVTPSGVVTTIAGSGSSGFADGNGTAAQFESPYALAIDNTGNLFVADANNHVIRKITPSGDVSTFAGLPGQAGFIDGAGNAAKFNYPRGLVFDTAGNLLVADTDNSAVRKITPAGVVSTISSENIQTPLGITVDDNGTIYTVGGDYVLRRVSSSGIASEVSLLNTSLNGPQHIILDGNTTLYVTDMYSGYLKKIYLDNLSADTKLPSGLQLDPATGTISGTPQTVTPAKDYSVTTTGLGGRSTAIVNIAVVTAPEPIIAYTPNSQTYYVNTAFVPYTPVNSGGIVESGSSMVVSFAGSGSQSNEDGNGPLAAFNYPQGVAIDKQGTIFVADGNNSKIRKITPDGIVTTFAGDGSYGSTNGTALQASFSYPQGMAIDAQGNLYVSDPGSYKIRKITPDGVVSTLAGTGSRGGVNGAGNVATFRDPRALAADAQGNIYVADGNNYVVRKITPAGVVSTIAGTLRQQGYQDGSTGTKFGAISGIATDNAGNIYVADESNHLIRKINQAGVVSTYAGIYNNSGNQDGEAANATFDSPYALTIDSLGNLFVSQPGTNQIRKISASGLVTTIAGNPNNSGGDNGVGSAATFDEPQGLAVDSYGNIYVSDGNHQIRKVLVNGYYIDKSLPAGLSFDEANGTITGPATAAKAATTYKITATNFSGSSTANVTIAINTLDQLAQATKVTFTETTTTSTKVKWTSGTGTLRTVFMKAGSDTEPVPVNGTTYPANAVFGTGAQIGNTGWFSVYSGTDSTVNVSGLTVATAYRTMVIEYIGIPGAEQYFSTTAAGNPANVSTLATDASLSALTISSGTLSPAFASGTFNYMVSAANTNTSITLTPIVSQVNSTVTVNGVVVARGAASASQTLAVGDNTINIVVTAQDGVTKLTYKIVVTRAAAVVTPVIPPVVVPPVIAESTLSNLVLSAGTLSPVFNSSAVSYTAAIGNTINSLSVRPTSTDAASTITVNGVAVLSGAASQSIAIPFGNTVITTVVTAQDGVTKTTYTVTVTRTASVIATLNNLGISEGALSPAFSTGVTAYTSSVNNASGSIAFTPSFTDATSTVTVNGSPVANNAQITVPLAIGNNSIVVVVTAQDGVTKRTYTIMVFRRLPAEDIVITNMMSPNGDGINDNWVVNDILLYPENEVKVLDQSGRVVFQQKNYTNGWTGTYNSSPLPEGTYFYVITLGKDNGIVKGFITIVRRQ